MVRKRSFRRFLLSLLLCSVVATLVYSIIVISKYFGTTNSSRIIGRVSENRSRFEETLKNFPWSLFNTSAFDNNLKGNLILTEELINKLIPFVTMEPLVSISETCEAPQFKPLNCSRKLKTPRRIAVLLQFGFDVDNLEIHLNELHDIVDRFFILESVRAHFGALRKPLVWETVKNQERFRKFLPKIVHFVLDDSEIVGIVEDFKNNENFRDAKSGDFFKLEHLQERVRWEKFQIWNNRTGFFGDDDLLGFGDTDEIPNRDAVNYLKNCELDTDPVDIGIWFPFGNINQAFQTHFPVADEFRFTLGDPTYWKLKTAISIDKKQNKYPSRNRGKSPTHVLGGMHLSHYGYLPYQIVKQITETERVMKSVSHLVYLIENNFLSSYDGFLKSGSNLLRLERKLAEGPDGTKDWIYDVNKMREAKLFGMDEVAILPWFYDCNRMRYPSWEGGHDTRLD